MNLAANLRRMRITKFEYGFVCAALIVITGVCGRSDAHTYDLGLSIQDVAMATRVVIRYRRETDNYASPVDPELFSRVFNSEVVVDRFEKINDLKAALRRLHVISEYSGALDISWGVTFTGRGIVPHSIYFDRTLRHAYIENKKFLVDGAFGDWLVRRYGTLRSLALTAR